ncbi:DNA alkylation repair protein [Paenibacillus sp. GCM10027627]|uniref:DNA alkylation repair protein n=1 Tax=unclassified Paenibacillus TaxID=185978 RepID=UPI003629D523
MPFQALVETFRQNGNEQNAKKMDAYMKNHFVHLGIKAPIRRQLTKEFVKEHPFQKEWVSTLWELPEREFQHVATDWLCLGQVKKSLTADDLPLLERLITTKSWWDTVDALAAHPVGAIFRSDEQARDEYVKRWNESDNMWLNRTAILFQLHYKKETDESLLYSTIARHMDSKQFFHQKAIGWALREYAKVNPQSVIAFVEANPLKPLSRREALKHLKQKVSE